MAAPAEDPAEAAADRTDVPDSLGGRRTFAPARPGVNVAHGEDALRAYLAWDGHARAAHMDPDAFARWLEREVLQYMTANRASLLRARADGVRRLHAPTLDPLAHALEPDEVVFTELIRGYLASSPPSWTRAMNTLDRMEAFDVVPGALSYNILLAKCADDNELERAEDIVDRMANEGVEPDRFTMEAVKKRRSIRSYAKKVLML